MATTNYVCGTGTWSGPKPGDPDNNLILSATPAFGGIDVSWSYPATNPYAVAHTVLYRGLSKNFAGAIQQAVVSGNQYYDKSAGDVPVEYFYWIQVVSVNGTYGDLIGPASAIARPTIEETLRQLSGKIDQGVLAQSLRSEIERISQLDTNLGKEVLNRINSNEALSAVLEAVQTEVGEAITLFENEVVERKDAGAALLSSINTLATGLNGNTAAILEEQTARTTAVEALALDIVTLYSKYAENTAAIAAESTARADQFTAFTTTVESMVAAVGDASNAAIQSERTARSDQYSALTQEITTLQSTLKDGYSAAIQTEADARVTADEALATLITTTESVIGDSIAAVQTTLQTNINVVGDKVADIGALYTAKVNVNGLIGGFGIYNDGSEVEAGFDVDRFWVGKDSASIKPFIVEGNEVFINNAVIHKLTADKIDSRGLTIQDENGNVLFGVGTTIDWNTGISGSDKPQSGATRNVYQGAWLVDTAYAVGDIVVDARGYGWSALTNHVSSSTNATPIYPASSNTNWTLYTVKGDSATSYWITTSAASISRDAAGKYSEPSVVFTAMAQTGTATPKNYVGRFIISTTANGTDYITQYLSTKDESSTTYVIPAGVKSIKVKLCQNEATEESEFQVILCENSVAIIEDGVEYDVKIESTNGTIFRVGQAKQTTLIARVFRNGEDVTDQLTPGSFKWKRVSMNPQEPPNDDATWDAKYQAGYKQITVSVDDVHAKATFHCQIVK